jgi:hypothetical protein
VVPDLLSVLSQQAEPGCHVAGEREVPATVFDAKERHGHGSASYGLAERIRGRVAECLGKSRWREHYAELGDELVVNRAYKVVGRLYVRKLSAHVTPSSLRYLGMLLLRHRSDKPLRLV